MQTSSLRYLVLTLALPFAGALVSSCAEQGEGERCDFVRNGNADCESGLICVAGEQLQGKLARCCPPGNSSDARCIRSGIGTGGAGGAGGASGTGGSSAGDASTGDAEGEAGAAGTAGTGGVGGTGGTDAGGEACAAPCNFTSECTAPLVCGPQGCCQPECLTDRDCAGNEQCVAGQCQPRVTEAGTG